MTDVPVDDPETLRRILANTEALLLDFDGPICSVFAGFPAAVVADQLRQILHESKYVNLPAKIAACEDPFEVLRYATTLGVEEAYYIEAAFRAHELDAIHTATPTPGGHELIHRWRETGRTLAIVSNNSTAAIGAYLRIHDLHNRVSFISARNDARIHTLKPSPYLVKQAITALRTFPSRAILIGDSATDIEAARAAFVRAIGYANKPAKAFILTKSGAVSVVDSISTLTQHIGVNRT
jgi:phosphoglycolate phosphatase